jgi:ABC-type transport system involved in cytochrome c biogenesis permease subunit
MKKLPALFIVALFLVSSTRAEAPNRRVLRADALKSVIILDQGRLKPLDSYARTLLLRFSGRQTYSGMAAIDWLARALFTPASADGDGIFLVNNPEILDAMGVAPQKNRRYSFYQLKTGYHELAALARDASAKEPHDRTLFDNEALRLFGNLQEYLELTSVMSFMEPKQELSVGDSIARVKLGLPAGPLSIAEIITVQTTLAREISPLHEAQTVSMTPTVREYMRLFGTLGRWEKEQRDQPFHIVPLAMGGIVVWQCPAIGALAGSPTLTPLMRMRRAYLLSEPQPFAEAVDSLKTAVRNVEGAGEPSTELAYNAVNPFAKAKILFGLAALLALILVSISYRRAFAFFAAGLIVAGFLLTTYGLVARLLIMHRPPVTNMFETFVFVAWTCSALGFVVELFNKKGLGFLVAALSGFFFLHLASRYSLDEDTMGVLAAVLNSNFWLTTHIVAISLGYAGCCCAGIVGHVYLVKKVFFRIPEERLASAAATLYGILAFGLLFTVAGTMLGGMWADQAWGRFWGWDPKENGALLIVIWCAAVMHARAAKLVGTTGTAIGAVVGFMLVMAAWIGVNLLGIGMHSYGFTSRGATVLFSVLGAEGVFLGALLIVFIHSRFSSLKCRPGYILSDEQSKGPSKS